LPVPSTVMKNMTALLALCLAPAVSFAGATLPPLEAVVSRTGVVTVRDGSAVVAVIDPGFYLQGWSHKSASTARPNSDGTTGGDLDLGDSGKIQFEASATRTGEALELHYVITPSASLTVESALVSVDLPANDWIGATALLGSTSAVVPLKPGTVTLLAGPTRHFTLGPSPIRSGLNIDITLNDEGSIQLQDSRQWGPNLEIRLDSRPNGQAWIWPANEPRKFDLVIGFGRRLKVVHDAPLTIKAGRDWVPMGGALDITPFSALDFGGLIPRFPAGVAGWLRVSPDQPTCFELEKRKGIHMRFYGANLCYGALYLPAGDADRLAERLMHIGYNSVRIHHYESVPWVPGAGLVSPTGPDSTILKGENLDKLEFLVSALKKRGIYISLDLYVSRAVRAGEVFPGSTGDLSYRFKSLVHVSDRAFNNWKEFARALLTHRNPYTSLAWKDDPVLAFISLVNEDNLANDLPALQADPREKSLWEKAWYRWPRHSGKPDWNSPLFRRFLWETQQATMVKMTKFLREELGVRALITGVNGWTDEWGTQAVRTQLDYVDNHWYWDHPVFLEKEWSLPSRGGANGESAIAQAGSLHEKSLTRLLDRPFTISEFNYGAPNKCAGEGGLLTGAFAAIQGWAGLWRFTYSSDRETVMGGGASDYFDLVNDPLRLASERVGMALFLREDLAEAPRAVAITGTAEDYLSRSGVRSSGELTKLGWTVRMGTLVGATLAEPGGLEMAVTGSPENAYLPGLVKLARQHGLIPAANETDAGAGIYESAGREIRLETNTGIVSVNTNRTAALAGPAGTSRKMGPVSISIGKTWSMVSLISLDRAPLAESGKILVTHLTDLKNTGEVFRGQDMAVLEDWGKGPWLVRSGKATVKIARARPPSGIEVWRLSLVGQRTRQVPAEFVNGAVTFTVSTSPETGATLDYEVVIKQ